MNTEEMLKKRGYYVQNSVLTTPDGKINLSSFTGAQVENKTMNFILKILIFIVLLNISTLLVFGGATLPAGFGLLYLSLCWFNSQQYEVIGISPAGRHKIAEVKTPYYKIASNEVEIAHALVSLVLEHNKHGKTA